VPIRILLVAIAVAMVAAACGSSSDTTTTIGATTTTAVVTTSADTDTTTTAATTTTELAAAGGPDCLVGTWVLDSDSFLETLHQVFVDQAGEGEVTDISGIYTVDMAADGTLTGERQGWGFSVATSQGTLEMAINGTEMGTWSATEDTITIASVVSDLDVSASVDVNGKKISITDMPIDVPEAIATDSTYSCGGDVLTVTHEGYTSVLNRA
jgi:hypothetical protein